MIIILLLGILSQTQASEFYGDEETVSSLQNSGVSQLRLSVQNESILPQSFDHSVSIASMFNSSRADSFIDESVSYRLQRRNLALLLTAFRFWPASAEEDSQQVLLPAPIDSPLQAEQRDRISTEADLGVFMTQNLSLLSEEPQNFHEQILRIYRQQIANGRFFVTQQEVMNWIYAELALRRTSTALEIDLPITEKIFTDIVHPASTRPYVIQLNTFKQFRRNGFRLPNVGCAVRDCVNYSLVDSFKYWQSKNLQVADFNHLLSEGDLVVSPFGEGEQCYTNKTEGLQFLQLQNVDFAELSAKHSELLNHEFISGADLVNIINKI